MSKLLLTPQILALFCVAIAAAAPPFQLEDEPRSSDVALEDDDFDLDDEPRSSDVPAPEDEDLDFDDEPRSTDSELESAEDDGDADYDYSGLVPDMRDGTQELAVAADNSEALEPSNRGWGSRLRRRFRRARRRWSPRIRKYRRYYRRARGYYNRYRAARAAWAMMG